MHSWSITKRQHSPHFILAAASFPKVSDGGELCVNGLAVEPPVVEVHDCFLCILLATKLLTGKKTYKWLLRKA